MRYALPFTFLVAACAIPMALGQDQQPAPSAMVEGTDEHFLIRFAKKKTDDASLLELLREKSRFDDDLANLPMLVKELGHAVFARREAAVKKLIALGVAALPALNQNLDNADPEAVKRSELCIEAIRPAFRPYYLPAVVRLLAKRSPDGALETLLGYLPYIPDSEVEEEIYYALDKQAGADGKVHPALEAALADRLAARRAVAACILGRRGSKSQKEKVGKLLTDPDAWVRLRAAQGLLAANDPKGVPALIDLLINPTLAIAWQAEELLHYVAMDASPREKVGPAAETREPCRAAWSAWWKRTSNALDLSRNATLPYRPGLVLLRDSTDRSTALSTLVHKLFVTGCDGIPRHSLEIAHEVDWLQWCPEGRLVGHFRMRPEDGLQIWDITGKLLSKERLCMCPGSTVQDIGAWRSLPSGRFFVASQYQIAECEAGGKLFNNVVLSTLYYERIHHRMEFLPEADWKVTSRLWSPSNRQVGIVEGIQVYAWQAVPLRNKGWLWKNTEYDCDGQAVWEAVSNRSASSALLIYPLVRFGFQRPRSDEMQLDTPSCRFAELASQYPLKRRRAAGVLYKFKKPSRENVMQAVGALADDDPRVRAGALQLIANSRPFDVDTARQVIHLLTDADPAVQDQAKAALCASGPHSLRLLLDAFSAKETNKNARRRAQLAAILINSYADYDAQAAKIVRAAFADPDPLVRETVTYGVVAGREPTVQFLRELLNGIKDSNEAVASMSITVIHLLGPQATAATPHLVAALSKETLRPKALVALAAVGERTPSNTQIILLPYLDRKHDANTVAMAAVAIASVKSDGGQAIPVLAACLKDERQTDFQGLTVRAFVAGALGEFGELAKPAIPALLKILRPNAGLQDDVNKSILGALKRIDSKEFSEAYRRIEAQGPEAIKLPTNK